MHNLVFYEPMHFHAALTLRAANPRVHSTVHLYATPGPDRDAFATMIDSFNRRADSPTHWQLEIHDRADPLAALIEERRGNVVVLAGRNDRKLETIARLNGGGFHVLADKPWLVDSAQLPLLDEVAETSPLAVDLMTARHDTLARARQTIVSDNEFFGGFDPDRRDGAAIEIGSTHHLFKTVNGAPLRRPAWYYDVAVQGDGMVDIQSHMVDQAQWLVAGERALDYQADFRLLAAERWTTSVPLELFQQSTGESEFPDSLRSAIDVDGNLQLACNGSISYELLGVRITQRAQWQQREPLGGGDIHTNVVRGRRATLCVRHGPETGFHAELHLAPSTAVTSRDLDSALRRWRETLPGIDLQPSELGYQVVWPAAADIGHESHFAVTLDAFLSLVDSGAAPPALAQRIQSRYRLLAAARQLALSR